MKSPFPELGLERVLASLEQELLAADDEEIAAIAEELGLKPDMKGSVALFGVTFTVDASKLKGKLAASRSGREKETRNGRALRRRAKHEPPAS
jgi:hypothetical protein